MTDLELSHRTDRGFGLRRVIEFEPRPRLTPDQIETDPAVLTALLDELFRRPFLYDWYSRNHKRYSDAELFLEVTLFKDDIPVDLTFWSFVHSAQETAGRFFDAAEDEIVQKLLNRKGASNVTTVFAAAGVAIWRVRRKKKA